LTLPDIFDVYPPDAGFQRTAKAGTLPVRTKTVKSLEAVMASTIRTGRARRFPHVSLNSDGRPHPLLNAASVLTLLIGFASFALGMLLRYDTGTGMAVAVAAAVTGLVALLGGLLTQMLSATREERIVIVVGIIAGFVGLALGLAHGGLGG
jgi:ammonia channel protein AmtB